MDWFPLMSDDDDDEADPPPPPPLLTKTPPPPPGPLTQGLRQLRHDSDEPLNNLIHLIDESEESVARPPGPLTQGLKALRAESSLLYPGHSPPSSPLLFSGPTGVSPSSPLLFTQPGEDEGSFLFTTATEESVNPWFSEEVVLGDSSIHHGFEVNEVTASPSPTSSPSSRSPRCPTEPPPPPPQRIASVVVQPLRITPIHQRLRPPIKDRLIAISHSSAASSSSSSSTAFCVVCGKLDGRKKTIDCSKCSLPVHSIACAGFASHRQAILQSATFSCVRCLGPRPVPQPLISAPAVASRVVIQTSHDDTIPATNEDSLTSSGPSSPVAASSPTVSPRAVFHSSPDHAHLASSAAPPLATAARLPFTLDDIFSTRIPVLRHCPKSARRELASLIDSVWSNVLRDPNNRDNWIKAFAYTKLVLFLPPGKLKFNF